MCPAGAVQLGQKLPGKMGPLTYPRQPLPTLGWNEENWDTDYKNSNRVSSATKPALPLARWPVRRTSRCRAICARRRRGATARHWPSSEKEYPFPAVCGRVCNRRCEAACTRGTVDEAVAIDEVKRFVAEQDFERRASLRAPGDSPHHPRRFLREDRHRGGGACGAGLRLLPGATWATNRWCSRSARSPAA